MLCFCRTCQGSRVAQRERAGPITQRSMDRNHPLLSFFFFLSFFLSFFFALSMVSAGNFGATSFWWVERERERERER